MQGPEIKFIANTTPENNNPTPWFNEKTRSISNPIIRFHNEIVDFVEMVAPTNDEHEAKMLIYKQVEAFMMANLSAHNNQDSQPSNQVIVMNPLFTHRVYMKNTELEIFVLLPQINQNQINGVVEKLIQGQNFNFCTISVEKKMEEIRVVLEHVPTQNIIWVNFVSMQWKQFLNDVEESVLTIPELKYLYIVNTCMIRQRGMHYSIKSLLIWGICSFFMFQRRRQRTRTLSQNFIKFMQFFGVGSTQQRKIVYKEKNIYEFNVIADQKKFQFYISKAIDISTMKTKQFFKVIQNRYRIISNYYYAPGASILSHLVNPCLGNFYY